MENTALCWTKSIYEQATDGNDAEAKAGGLAIDKPVRERTVELDDDTGRNVSQALGQFESGMHIN